MPEHIPPANDPIVTKELVWRCQTGNGGWSLRALAYLGIAWPPRKGWKKDIIGAPRDPMPGAPDSWPKKLMARCKNTKAVYLGRKMSRAQRRAIRHAAREHHKLKNERVQVNRIIRDRERARLVEEQAKEHRAEARRLG